MAETVQITARGQQATIRNPWGVLGLTIITLGIYYLFWYFFVNREMSDWGERHKTDIGLSPGTSLVAITIGSIIIVPPYVSIFHTGKRMQLAQRVGGVHGGSGLTFFFLSIIPIANLFAPVYLQSELNKVWERERHEQAATPELMTLAVEPVFAEQTPTPTPAFADPALVAPAPAPITPPLGAPGPEDSPA
jgi:hypothetical protein